MWYDGLLYKLRSMGISAKLYNLVGNRFQSRFQSVILNEQTLSWQPVLVGVPKGSILGPLLVLADDTSLFTLVKDKNKSAYTLNNELLLISK